MGHCLMMRKGEVHTAPVTGVLASSLAVGSTVKLMEGGTAVEYLVVNQGIPENSSLYDASCDGTWLLRKVIYNNRKWDEYGRGDYSISRIGVGYESLLNSLGKSIVKEVKIPYVKNRTGPVIMSGSNGLSCKSFSLSAIEIGATSAVITNLPVDGAKLTYFETGNTASAMAKRITTYSNSPYDDKRWRWWTRTTYEVDTYSVYSSDKGEVTQAYATVESGVRPAFILPSNALFDKTTMILKGVK